MSKYIIDVGDAYAEYICGKGDMLCLPVRINEFEDNWLNTNIPLTPYTEPDTEKVREEAFKNGYDAACNDIDIKSKTSAAYRKGLEDAWEAARKIDHMSDEDIKNVFGCGFSAVFETIGASEAIEKLKAYEQDAEIKVGDEVINQDKKAVVTEITDRFVRIMYSDGGGYALFSEDMTKTGRHFPEIAAVLAKMKEES